MVKPMACLALIPADGNVGGSLMALMSSMMLHLTHWMASTKAMSMARWTQMVKVMAHLTLIPVDGNIGGSLGFDGIDDAALNSLDGINKGMVDSLLDLDGKADGSQDHLGSGSRMGLLMELWSLWHLVMG
jgi:hypothetical protein